MQQFILVVAFVIVFTVILLSVKTTSKAYSYRHTVDPDETQDGVEENENKENR